jgi:HAD superfamily hydrolase (TIGR01457 family)
MSKNGPVARRYDALFFDLDGVVYRGDQAVPGAPAALEQLRALNIKLLFLTNNSARTPEVVADRLERLGVAADPGEILTSAFATAALLRREEAAGQRAFVIGERGVLEALQGVGIEILEGEPERADLVVVGWDRSVDYARLRTASLLVERGARLVATNRDASYPAPDGLWPGAGAILSAITTTTGATPTIVGKPARPLFQAAAELTGATQPLVVGDRLDTDIAGARSMGWDSLLVLSGAATPATLLETSEFPTYVGRDISVLLEHLPPARLRSAKSSDVADIKALLEEAGLNAEGAEDRLEGTVVSATSAEAGRIDATACVVLYDGSAILRSVAVRKAVQGRGLGLLAVAAAVAEARGAGARHVSLFTQTAPAFFELLGFRKVGRTELPETVRTSRHAEEECAASATAMVRDF